MAILLENIFHSKILKKILPILKLIDNETKEWGFVGGIPRDFLFYQKKLKTNEIDIIFFHPIDKIFHFLIEKLIGNIKEKYFHPRFLTAKLVFESGANRLIIDLITARNEYYPQPASLPIIRPTQNIKEDLIRRDITINSILFKRIPNYEEISFEIVDPFGGYKDLTQKRIIVLHNETFKDDPTRIYRIFRYKVRMDLEIEKETYKLIKNSKHFIKMLSINRVFNELKQIFNEKKFDKVIEEFFKIGFDPINLEETNENNLQKDLKILRKSIISFEKFFNNQKLRFKTEFNKIDLILSFLMANKFIKNPKYRNLISKYVEKLSYQWQEFSKQFEQFKEKLKSKHIKRVFLENFCNENFIKSKKVELFVILLFFIFKYKALNLKFAIKKMIKRLFLIDNKKITPNFINSISIYYFEKNLDLETIKKIINTINRMFILNKVRTTKQIIRFAKKIIKREILGNIE